MVKKRKSMRVFKRLVFCLVTGSLLSLAQGELQTSAPANGAQNASPQLSLPDYKIGPGDLIEVKVFGVQDFSQVARVTSSGVFSMPLLGPIDASGKTAAEVESEITGRLTEQRLVKNPQVTVFVKEYRSQPVHVLGAVNKPGQYVISGELRLVDAITLAGGLDPLRAGETITVKRRRPAGGGALGAIGSKAEDDAPVETVNIKALLEDGDSSSNLVLLAGDIVQVAERKAEVFYIVGDVGKAGAFEYPKDAKAGIRASAALIYAGGPARTANAKKSLLVRYGAGGQREQFAIDFRSILEGKKPDIAVLPNDIIYVPGSVTKTFGYALAQAVPWAVANGLVFAIP
jgi:polysaccharide export outer membrane protein